MKLRLLIRMVLIVSLFTLFFCTNAAAEAPAPKGPLALVKEPIFDFGSVYAGQDVLHAFEIKNIGDAPLIIEEVKTG